MKQLLIPALVITGWIFPLAESEAALLTYWNFNNDSPAFVSPALGSFNTTGAAFGEQYTAATRQLSSNTVNGTIFSSSAVYMDFSNLATGANNTVINGIDTAFGTRATTTTGNGGYGVFSDTTVNRLAADGTAAGSLIIMNPGGHENGHYITLRLSSLGYDSLAFSYATRMTNGSSGNTQTWTYSTDGSTFNALATQTLAGTGLFGTVSMDLSGISAINNASTFYLRMAISGPAASFAFDNMQLTGAAVPEPGSLAILGLGSFGLAWLRVRRRLAA